MTYEIYRYIFIGAAILSGIMFLVAVLLFVVLKIPQVVGDLSGATARKAIQNIREQAENAEDGKTDPTDKISPSGHILRHNSGAIATGVVTEKISTQELFGGEETTVLSGEETTVLNSMEETTVLQQDAIATEFEVAYEITYLHSEEWADI